MSLEVPVRAQRFFNVTNASVLRMQLDRSEVIDVVYYYEYTNMNN